jgi:hypothetical protein
MRRRNTREERRVPDVCGIDVRLVLTDAIPDSFTFNRLLDVYAVRKHGTRFRIAGDICGEDRRIKPGFPVGTVGYHLEVRKCRQIVQKRLTVYSSGQLRLNDVPVVNKIQKRQNKILRSNNRPTVQNGSVNHATTGLSQVQEQSGHYACVLQSTSTSSVSIIQTVLSIINAASNAKEKRPYLRGFPVLNEALNDVES